MPENFIVDTAERVFADHADPQTIVHSRNDAWKQPLWSALEEIGLTLAWLPEELGGGGASLADGFAVIRSSGRAGLAAPLAETLLAAWLLGRVDIASASGAMTVAPVRQSDRLTIDAAGRLNGLARRVPFAREAAHLAVLATGPSGDVVALVRAADCVIAPVENLAGDARDTVEFSNVSPVVARPADNLAFEDLLRMGAAIRAEQIAGALEAALAISVRYATERVAFEKPISKFQAVQHNLARLGGEVAAALSAAASAADTIAEDGLNDDAALLEIASAKIRTGEAAEVGMGIAHQVHGAIGYTDEHILHRFSLRALAWRDDFGSEAFWAEKLGGLVAIGGAEGLWPLLASR